ncbi:MAG: hypothetical protein R2748_23220 [Bryobacterales bacterium]
MAQIKQGRWVTASGQGVSSALRLGTETLLGFYTPAALTAAELKIQASHDGATFVDVVSNDAVLKVQATSSAYIALEPTKLLGAVQVRLAHLDGAGAATTESAERVFEPVFRAFE